MAVAMGANGSEESLHHKRLKLGHHGIPWLFLEGTGFQKTISFFDGLMLADPVFCAVNIMCWSPDVNDVQRI
jgi:hypothetical protein